MTVFADAIFKKVTLSNDRGSIVVSMRQSKQSNFAAALTNNDSLTEVVSYCVDPAIKPDWLIPGVNLQGTIDGYVANFKMLATIQNRVAGIEEITGSKIRFSVTIVSKFIDDF